MYMYIQILLTLGIAEHQLDVSLCNACQGENISFGFNAENEDKNKNKRFSTNTECTDNSLHLLSLLAE